MNEVLTKTQLYKKIRSAWDNMITRCKNPKHPQYKQYSKLGISKEWLEFSNFRKDLYDKMREHISIYGKSNTTLDRIDNNKGYSRENCRWATWEVQYDNTSKGFSKVCKSCNYNWNAKKEKPRQCPNCKRQIKYG